MLTIKSLIDRKSFLLFFCCIIVKSDCIRHPTTDPGPALIFLDVDNTLYSEADAGIEAQIVKNTHSFCRTELGITASEADGLFHEYGSTVEGLRRTLWQAYDADRLQESLRSFYEKVYQNIDMSRLLLTSDIAPIGSTGYSHAQQERRLVCQLLKACPDPIAFASNSPSWHVQKVLRCMGLDNMDFEEMLTPDRLADYPTKHEPIAFFAGSSTLERQNGKILFFDDSLNNLNRVSAFLENVEPIHVKAPGNTLGDALLRHLGLVSPEYVFDAVEYLESKNIVDSQSIHPEIWNQVISHLRNSIQKEGSINVVDVGAGRLHILSLLLLGETSRGLNALFGHPKKDLSVYYTAYESNEKLLPACQDQLQSLGFHLVERVSEKEFVYSKENWSVRLILANFDEADAGNTSPDLIVGCCFADLIDPNILVPSLLRSFQLLEERMSSKETLIYFPITFAGATQFFPPRPFEPSPESSSRAIPADTTAFQLYSKALSENMGHNLDPFLLKQVMEGYGASFVAKGQSDWKIDHSDVPYLFDTMLYFFGTTAGPPLLEAGVDAARWIQRARRNRPTIQVSNVDLLFQIGGRLRKNSDACDPVSNSSQSTMHEIQFTAPGSVTTIQKDIPEIGPDEVLVESSASLISSGTELKVFKGMFEDVALDVIIQGMEDERMAYPLAYGYCLVGRIVKCGRNVSKEKFLGRLAFTFAAHATHVVTSVDALQLVPSGISAEDAIFMPSVETALSLVHDAHVRVGENVAVYGQGLIGLLVTAIMYLHHHRPSTLSGNHGIITTFDTIPDRLAASALMGATQALLPGGTSGPFDVTIEVSGNARALQSAIDSTADGGRIIVGSWYGNTDVSLKLGMDFHRSHKTLQTSQVSELPASLLGLWDKKRRFGLAWELVRELRPSRLLTKTTKLVDAMEAYQALDQGTEIAVAFGYEGSSM